MSQRQLYCYFPPCHKQYGDVSWLKEFIDDPDFEEVGTSLPLPLSPSLSLSLSLPRPLYV